MADSPRWFDRSFRFDFEPDIFPALVARLKQYPQQLRSLFADFPPEKLREKSDGKWSALEQLGHLIVLESLWQTRIHEFLAKEASKKELSPADLDNKATGEADFNSQSLNDLLDRFEGIRAATILILDQANPDPSYELWHPRLRKPMRLVDHLYFMAEHDDHHRKSIERLAQ